MAKSFPDLEELVPHSREMLLLDHVLAWDGTVLQCQASIRPDTVFVIDGEAPALMAIEHLAQTCATFMGLRAHENNEPVRLGYLLGCRTFDVHTDVLAVGDTLVLEVQEVGALQTMASFECRAMRGDEVVATGVLNVMYADTPVHKVGYESQS